MGQRYRAQILVASIVLSGLSCVACAQGMVKCQDKNGGTVYVDRPCAVLGLREIGTVKDRVNVAPPSPPVAKEKDAASPDCATDAKGICGGVNPGPAEKQGEAKHQDPARARAIRRCKKNRGANCESEAGLEEWLRQDQPLSEEEQQAAVAERRLRERCVKAKYMLSECADLPTDP